MRMHTRPVLALIVSCVFTTASLVAPAIAQTTTGSIIGTVYDQNRAPLAGVKVTAINERTGDSRSGLTGPDGTYRIPLLPPGRYTIRASLAGLADSLLTNFDVPLTSKVTFVPPITLLPPGAGAVAAGAAGAAGVVNLVAIEDPARRGNFKFELLGALPLAGVRSFDQLALLLPGVAPPPQTTGANGPGVGPGVGTAGQFSVNGQRARANNFTVDGSDNNDQDIGVRRQGFVAVAPQSLESVQEFQVTTLLADAEAGRNTGGQANAVSRAGSNDVHGEVYGYLTDSALNARDFFDYSDPLVNVFGQLSENPEESPFTRYQVGAAIGAPLVENRWHVFAAAERLGVNATRETHFVTPTRAERNRALQLAASRSLVGFDVLGPGFYPEPNDPGGPYADNTVTQFLDASGEGWLATVKTDYQTAVFSWPTTVSLRYNFTDDETRIPAVDDAINASLLARTRTHNVALVANSQITERDANQLRLSFGRTRLAFDEVPGSPFVFQTPLGTSGPIGRILIAASSPIGVDPFTFPQGRANNTFQIADTFNMTRGRHAIKFGGDVRRVQLNSFLDRNYRAQVAFSSNVVFADVGVAPVIETGATFAALGIPSDLQQSLAVDPNSSLALRFTEASVFVHDTWRIHPHVTLSGGLRYEVSTVPEDAAGRLEDALGIAASGAFPGDTSDEAVQEFLLVLAAQGDALGRRTTIYDPDRNNFAPRAGVAWDIGGRGRYTLRAGYGLYYDPILGTVVSQSRNVFPSFIPINVVGAQRFLQSLDINPAQLFGLQLVAPGTNELAVPIGDVAATLGGLFLVDTLTLGFTLPEQRFRTPYVHHYGVTAEAALLDRYVASVAYVGTSGHKLIRFRTPNGGPFTPASFLPFADSTISLFPQQDRPNPVLGSYTVIESSASSSYNALQASLERRADDGLAFLLAYTWAHAIDDVSDVFGVAGAPLQAQDELGRDGGLALERASASFDVRHRFTASWAYDLPFGEGDFWLGGFQLSGIATLQSGQPYTVNTSFDANLDGNLTDRLDTTEGLTLLDDGRVRIVRDPSRPFTAFLAPLDLAAPRSGSVGRNTFRAAGIASVDLALSKRFTFGNGQSVGVRVEAFNVFNRTHFGIPVRILESPAFGASTTTTVPARVVQFAVRYSF
jgi:hypothetical protein